MHFSRGRKPYSRFVSVQHGSSRKRPGFSHKRGKCEEVLTVGRKTSSLCTCVVVVPGQHGPEMDYRGVLHPPYSTPIITQTSLISLSSEYNTKVAPIERDPGPTQQERSGSSPCVSTRSCIVLRDHVSSPKLNVTQRLKSECVHRSPHFKMETAQ